MKTNTVRSAPPERIIAPWTPEQVEALNRWQSSTLVPSLICPHDHDNHAVLVATDRGWYCPHDDCFYTQRWSNEEMLHINDYDLAWEVTTGKF